MPPAYPWHSTRPGETVYHNNTDCTEGNNIERRYYALGDGGLKLCHHCATLSGGTFNRMSALRDLLSGKR
ncbi:MAG TPA: hypothetical protein VF532_08945 [Candidatus Angelobacter sp.]